MQILSTWNVTNVTEEFNLIKFYLILTNLNLNGHMWLMAAGQNISVERRKLSNWIKEQNPTIYCQNSIWRADPKIYMEM